MCVNKSLPSAVISLEIMCKCFIYISMHFLNEKNTNVVCSVSERKVLEKSALYVEKLQTRQMQHRPLILLQSSNYDVTKHHDSTTSRRLLQIKKPPTRTFVLIQSKPDAVSDSKL